MNQEIILVEIFDMHVVDLTLPLAVLEGTVIFSVDLSWVVDAVSTVVFMLVVVIVDSVVYASVVVTIVIAVDDMVDASVVVTSTFVVK